MLRKCWSVRCSADMASARCRIVLDQPSPAARPGTRYAGQLWRSPATAKLHNAALPSVSASQSQAPFVAATARAIRVKATGRYAKLPTLGTVAQPSALPVRFRALCAASWLPCGCRGTVALVRRFAQCFWSVACGQSSCMCPAHPCGPRRYAAFGPALGARPPPRGSLIPAPRGPAGLRPALSFGELRLPDQAGRGLHRKGFLH